MSSSSVTSSDPAFITRRDTNKNSLDKSAGLSSKKLKVKEEGVYRDDLVIHAALPGTL